MIQIDTIPKELQSIQPFVRRFNELEAHNPVIAYWSLYWAAQMALSSSHGVSNECKDFLLSLIEHLEDLRKNLGENENVSDETSAKAYVESFSLEVLVQAERNSKNGKPDVQAYLAARDFLELSRIWGPPTEQITKSIKFCKLRALQVANPQRKAKTPSNHATEELQQSSTNSTTLPTQEAAVETNASASHETSFALPTTSPAASLSISPTKSAAVSSEPNVEADVKSLSSTPAAPQLNSPSHSYEPTTFPSTTSITENLPTIDPTRSTRSSSHIQSLSPESKQTSDGHRPPSPTSITTTSTSIDPSVAFSSKSTLATTRTNAPLSRPSQPTKASPLNKFSALEAIQSARSHARYAYSALDYEDTTTAIHHLKSALKLLEEEEQGNHTAD
ncbi:Vps20 associated protein Vta1 [Schizosaccharomyces pombe]|uniref:Vacuolar protein sorting-associated protein vts1 n=1 Tax=Schizosaccharomyces pombe (strain 972 / ATCC 24843) TaxID=284812 RepID=VTA1_SCHPO|nr:putative Vts1 family protein [Schizosaccharomyces pombe]O13703.2 RecName: Full=Vacuolar protein sorting-associated protein vts1; AltName: Full=VPS20-associated protein 1 [Schizosaccharomyces pombe 972h-]CAB11767.2 Vps20 associated proten Vts1 (predicted) [Schizosaccharomyces pombe]|eukprot:NP_593652.2 putative Vts1 family protein [Schizosaccharomyces pombe]